MNTETPKHERARCPNCKKEGGVKAPSSIRQSDGRLRYRHCTLCGYFFETVMKLPLECPHCDAFNNFTVGKTRNLRNGVYRLYRCRDCKKYLPTFEAFPIPEEKRKRPDPRNYY